MIVPADDARRLQRRRAITLDLFTRHGEAWNAISTIRQEWGVYRRETDRLAKLRQRREALDARLKEITVVLLDSKDKERGALIRERGDLLVERSSLPLDLAIVARRAADAHIAWARRVYGEAIAEFRAADQRIADHERERRPLREALTRFSSSTQLQEDHADAIAVYRARLDEIGAELAPAYKRRDEAQVVAGMIQGSIRRSFGYAVEASNVTAHHVEQYVDRQRRAAA